MNLSVHNIYTSIYMNEKSIYMNSSTKKLVYLTQIFSRNSQNCQTNNNALGKKKLKS